jgi:hypothetical protein
MHIRKLFVSLIYKTITIFGSHFFYLFYILQIKSKFISLLRDCTISNSPIHGGCPTSHRVLFSTSILNFLYNCKLISYNYHTQVVLSYR